MVKIEVISEAAAIVETTKGPARVRLQEAIQVLGELEPGQVMRVTAAGGAYKRAFRKASAALGIAVAFQLAEGLLYIKVRRVQRQLVEEAPPQEGQVSEPPDPESSARANESLGRTREDLDAALKEGCPFSSEPHGHDAENKCLLPEKSA